MIFVSYLKIFIKEKKKILALVTVAIDSEGIVENPIYKGHLTLHLAQPFLSLHKSRQPTPKREQNGEAGVSDRACGVRMSWPHMVVSTYIL